MGIVDQMPEIPDGLQRYAQPELDKGFSNPDNQFAVVGRSGCVYLFGDEEARTEAMELCASVRDTLDEDLFVFNRPDTVTR